MAKKLKKGVFITFEGPEGCGKSTHSRRVNEDLLAEGYDVVYTAEPGGTALGRKIRDVLLGKDDVRISDLAELLLFEADRAQHVGEVIRPALEAGSIVICDRFNTATFAYQGHGLGMDMDMIRRMDAVSTGGVEPDLVVLMDIDVRTGLERACSKGSPDRMEEKSVGFHEKVRRGYLALAGGHPGTIKTVKVKDNIDDTYNAVKEVVHGIIEKHTGTG